MRPFSHVILILIPKDNAKCLNSYKSEKLIFVLTLYNIAMSRVQCNIQRCRQKFLSKDVLLFGIPSY